jgi:hypothetical protein
VIIDPVETLQRRDQAAQVVAFGERRISLADHIVSGSEQFLLYPQKRWNARKYVSTKRK